MLKENGMKKEETFEMCDDSGIELKDELIPDNKRKSCIPYKWIDTGMLSVKLCYIFHHAAIGAWYPFMLLFLTSLDLNPLLAGTILSLRSLSSAIVTPLWGFLIDYTGRKKLILAVITIGMAATILPIPFVAVEWNDFTTSNSSISSYLGENDTSPTSTERKYCTTSCGDSRMFHGMLVLFIVIGIFDGVLPGFLDSNAVSAIQVHTKETSYGKQRVYGAASFGIGSVIAGATSGNFRHAYISNFSAVIFTAVPLLLAALPFCLLVVMQTEKNQSKKKRSEDVPKNVKLAGIELAKLALKTCLKPYNFVFLFSNFLQGTSHAIMYNFLFLHMKDYMNSKDSILGWTIVAANIGEILLFPFSKVIIRRFGKMNCFLFSMLVNGIRFILLGFCTNPWLVLPIQLLHSFAFALFFSAMIELLSGISPQEIFCTMFGINSSLFFSVATVLGTLLGGWMYENYNGNTLFVGLGVVCCAWTLVAFFIFMFLSKQRQQQRDVITKERNT